MTSQTTLLPLELLEDSLGRRALLIRNLALPRDADDDTRVSERDLEREILLRFCDGEGGLSGELERDLL